MPVNLPARTTQQITDLVDGISVNSFYPYTFRVNRLMTNGNFPTADTGGSGRFVQLVFTPAISLGIALIETSVIGTGAGQPFTCCAVSYASSFTLGDATSLTTPTDEANIISCQFFGNQTQQAFSKYGPGDYYVAANTSIYIYFWLVTSAIGSGANYVGNCTIHTIPIGLGN